MIGELSIERFRKMGDNMIMVIYCIKQKTENDHYLQMHPNARMICPMMEHIWENDAMMGF